MESQKALVDLLEDLAPLHMEIDQLHHTMGKLLETKNITSEEFMVSMRKGRNELAKVALKERYVLAEHALRAGVNKGRVPLSFLASMYPERGLISQSLSENLLIGSGKENVSRTPYNEFTNFFSDTHISKQADLLVKHASTSFKYTPSNSVHKTKFHQTPVSVLSPPLSHNSQQKPKQENISSVQKNSKFIVRSQDEIENSEARMKRRSLRTLKKHILSQIDLQNEILESSGVGSSEGSAAVRVLKADLAKVEAALLSLSSHNHEYAQSEVVDSPLPTESHEKPSSSCAQTALHDSVNLSNQSVFHKSDGRASVMSTESSWKVDTPYPIPSQKLAPQSSIIGKEQLSHARNLDDVYYLGDIEISKEPSIGSSDGKASSKQSESSEPQLFSTNFHEGTVLENNKAAICTPLNYSAESEAPSVFIKRLSLGGVYDVALETVEENIHVMNSGSKHFLDEDNDQGGRPIPKVLTFSPNAQNESSAEGPTLLTSQTKDPVNNHSVEAEVLGYANEQDENTLKDDAQTKDVAVFATEDSCPIVGTDEAGGLEYTDEQDENTLKNDVQTEDVAVLATKDESCRTIGTVEAGGLEYTDDQDENTLKDDVQTEDVAVLATEDSCPTVGTDEAGGLECADDQDENTLKDDVQTEGMTIVKTEGCHTIEAEDYANDQDDISLKHQTSSLSESYYEIHNKRGSLSTSVSQPAPASLVVPPEKMLSHNGSGPDLVRNSVNRVTSLQVKSAQDLNTVIIAVGGSDDDEEEEDIATNKSSQSTDSSINTSEQDNEAFGPIDKVGAGMDSVRAEVAAPTTSGENFLHDCIIKCEFSDVHSPSSPVVESAHQLQAPSLEPTMAPLPRPPPPAPVSKNTASRSQESPQKLFAVEVSKDVVPSPSSEMIPPPLDLSCLSQVDDSKDVSHDADSDDDSPNREVENTDEEIDVEEEQAVDECDDSCEDIVRAAETSMESSSSDKHYYEEIPFGGVAESDNLAFGTINGAVEDDCLVASTDRSIIDEDSDLGTNEFHTSSQGTSMVDPKPFTGVLSSLDNAESDAFAFMNGVVDENSVWSCYPEGLNSDESAILMPKPLNATTKSSPLKIVKKLDFEPFAHPINGGASPGIINSFSSSFPSGNSRKVEASTSDSQSSSVLDDSTPAASHVTIFTSSVLSSTTASQSSNTFEGRDALKHASSDGGETSLTQEAVESSIPFCGEQSSSSAPIDSIENAGIRFSAADPNTVPQAAEIHLSTLNEDDEEYLSRSSTSANEESGESSLNDDTFESSEGEVSNQGINYAVNLAKVRMEVRKELLGKFGVFIEDKAFCSEDEEESECESTEYGDESTFEYDQHNVACEHDGAIPPTALDASNSCEASISSQSVKNIVDVVESHGVPAVLVPKVRSDSTESLEYSLDAPNSPQEFLDQDDGLLKGAQVLQEAQLAGTCGTNEHIEKQINGLDGELTPAKKLNTSVSDPLIHEGNFGAENDAESDDSVVDSDGIGRLPKLTKKNWMNNRVERNAFINKLGDRVCADLKTFQENQAHLTAVNAKETHQPILRDVEVGNRDYQYELNDEYQAELVPITRSMTNEFENLWQQEQKDRPQSICDGDKENTPTHVNKDDTNSSIEANRFMVDSSEEESCYEEDESRDIDVKDESGMTGLEQDEDEKVVELNQSRSNQHNSNTSFECLINKIISSSKSMNSSTSSSPPLKSRSKLLEENIDACFDVVASPRQDLLSAATLNENALMNEMEDELPSHSSLLNHEGGYFDNKDNLHLPTFDDDSLSGTQDEVTTGSPPDISREEAEDEQNCHSSMQASVTSLPPPPPSTSSSQSPHHFNSNEKESGVNVKESVAVTKHSSNGFDFMEEFKKEQSEIREYGCQELSAHQVRDDEGSSYLSPPPSPPPSPPTILNKAMDDDTDDAKAHIQTMAGTEIFSSVNKDEKESIKNKSVPRSIDAEGVTDDLQHSLTPRRKKVAIQNKNFAWLTNKDINSEEIKASSEGFHSEDEQVFQFGATRPPFAPTNSTSTSIFNSPASGRTSLQSAASQMLANSPITSPSWRRSTTLASLSPIAPNSNFKRSCGTLEQILEKWNDDEEDEAKPRVVNIMEKSPPTRSEYGSSDNGIFVPERNKVNISQLSPARPPPNFSRPKQYSSPKRQRSPSPPPAVPTSSHIPLFQASISMSGARNRGNIGASPSKKVKSNVKQPSEDSTASSTPCKKETTSFAEISPAPIGPKKLFDWKREEPTPPPSSTSSKFSLPSLSVSGRKKTLAPMGPLPSIHRPSPVPTSTDSMLPDRFIDDIADAKAELKQQQPSSPPGLRRKLFATEYEDETDRATGEVEGKDERVKASSEVEWGVPDLIDNSDSEHHEEDESDSVFNVAEEVDDYYEQYDPAPGYKDILGCKNTVWSNQARTEDMKFKLEEDESTDDDSETIFESEHGSDHTADRSTKYENAEDGHLYLFADVPSSPPPPPPRSPKSCSKSQPKATRSLSGLRSTKTTSYKPTVSTPIGDIGYFHSTASERPSSARGPRTDSRGKPGLDSPEISIISPGCTSGAQKGIGKNVTSKKPITSLRYNSKYDASPATVGIMLATPSPNVTSPALSDNDRDLSKVMVSGTLIDDLKLFNARGYRNKYMQRLAKDDLLLKEVSP